MQNVELYRRARLAGGFTYREVAILADVDPSTIASYETHRGRPSSRMAARWEQAIAELLESRFTQTAGAIHALKGRLPQLPNGEEEPS
jgi:transcriptional regulator with XRE-family HTH domain